MKLLLPFLLIGFVSAQQCIEPKQLAPIDAAAVAAIRGLDIMEDLEEEEYFEKVENGWIAGTTKGGQRTGTWWFYQDADNWKKVTYDKWGDVVLWQRLIAGRRLFEIKYNYYTLLDTGTINVYELDWTKNKVLDWKFVEKIHGFLVINVHGHFLNNDGTPSAGRTNFGEKYKWGDNFERSIMGVPLEQK